MSSVDATQGPGAAGVGLPTPSEILRLQPYADRLLAGIAVSDHRQEQAVAEIATSAPDLDPAFGLPPTL